MSFGNWLEQHISCYCSFKCGKIGKYELFTVCEQI